MEKKRPLLSKIKQFGLVSKIFGLFSIIRPKKIKSVALILAVLLFVAAAYPIIKNLKQNQYSKAATPEIYSVFPDVGSLAGGDKIRIKGNNFEAPVSVIQVSAGRDHSCALTSNKKIYCWGWNNYGQLGNGSNTDSSLPVLVSQGAIPNDVTIKQIIAGWYHTCVLASNNQVYCWGGNLSGELGIGSTVNSPIPVQLAQGAIPSGVYLTQLASDSDHTCAIASNNWVYCWGGGYNGPIGNGVAADSTAPAAVLQGEIPAGVSLVKIAVGDNHSCAIGSNGRAYCWGDNTYGKLGNNSTARALTPVAVSQGAIPAGISLTDIDAGDFHTCALASNDQIYCWGYNRFGQSGNNPLTTIFLTPVQASRGAIPSDVTLVELVSDADYNCVLTSGRWAYCWGDGYSGQLGNGAQGPFSAPVAVVQGAIPAGAYFNQLSTGYADACALVSTGRVYCWGSNSRGQLGNGSTDTSSTPVTVNQAIMNLSAGTRVKIGSFEVPAANIRYISSTEIELTVPPKPDSVQLNTPTSIILTNSDGSSQIYHGIYTYYQAGTTSISAASPNRGLVTGGNGISLTGDWLDPIAWKSVTVQAGSACGVTHDNKVYCWGDKDEVGSVQTANLAVPTPIAAGEIPAGVAITKISSGLPVCGLGTDQWVYYWGNSSNLAQSLGNNSSSGSATPVKLAQGQIPLGAKFIDIDSGINHACGLVDDGKVYCWGVGDYGKLGNDSLSNALVPALVSQGAIPSGATITSISVAAFNACAISSDDKIYCWGAGQSGRLGNGANSDSSVPVAVSVGQIPSGLKILDFEVSYDGGCVVMSDFKAYCWGVLFGTTPQRLRSTVIDNLELIQLRRTSSNICVLTRDGTVYCRGYNGYGQLGHDPMFLVDENGLSTSEEFITNPNIIVPVKYLAISSMNFCLMYEDDHKINCWGYDGEAGALGAGYFSGVGYRTVPLQIADNSYRAIIGDTTNDGTLGTLIRGYSTSTDSFKAPTAAQANSSSVAPHTGPVNVSLLRLIDGFTTNQVSYTYYTVPSAPLDVQAAPTLSGDSTGAIKVLFKSPSTNYDDATPNLGNRHSPVTDYQIEYCLESTVNLGQCEDPSNSTPSAANPTNWVVQSHAPIQSTPTVPADHNLSATISNLTTSGVKYLVRVAARNQAGLSAYAVAQATLPSFINLTAAANLDINLTPLHDQTISTNKLNLTTGSNLPAGYTLRLSTNSTSNQLLHTTDSSLSINSTANSFTAPAALGVNTWGFYLPNISANQQFNLVQLNQFSAINSPLLNQNTQTQSNKFAEVPTNANKTNIFRTNQAISGKNLELMFGANISRDLPSGAYRQTILFEAVGQ